MHLVQQILFILCAGISVYFFSKKVGEIRRNIKLGKDEDLTDNSGARWKNMVLMALGQQKMFKKPIRCAGALNMAGSSETGIHL